MNPRATTGEPMVRLLVDGRVLAASRVEYDIHVFDIPPGAADIRILSRSVVPSEMDAGHPDGRRLGVSVIGMALRSARLDITLRWDDPELVDGFHQAEDGHRWTNGRGQLPPSLLAPFTEPLTLELHVQRTGLRYPVGLTPEV